MVTKETRGVMGFKDEKGDLNIHYPVTEAEMTTYNNEKSGLEAENIQDAIDELAKGGGDGYVSQEQVGVPGGVATLGGDGKLTVSQRPEIDAFTREETAGKITDAVRTHNSDTGAHGNIQAKVADVAASVRALELKLGAEVTENQFTVSFGSLRDVEITGVWNASQSRIEF